MVRAQRVYAATSTLHRLSAILFGRPGGGVPVEDFDEYDEAILQVVAEEEGHTDLPIVTRMDFGHTDPMMVLPCGIVAQVDCDDQTFSLIEAAVTDDT